MAKATISLEDAPDGALNVLFSPSIGEALRRVEGGHKSGAYIALLGAAAAIAGASEVPPEFDAETAGSVPAPSPETPHLTSANLRDLMAGELESIRGTIQNHILMVIAEREKVNDRARFKVVPARESGIFELIDRLTERAVLAWTEPRVETDCDTIQLRWSIWPVEEA